MVPTVHLILVLHDKEGVIVQIAEELDVGPAKRFDEPNKVQRTVGNLTRLSSSTGSP